MKDRGRNSWWTPQWLMAGAVALQLSACAGQVEVLPASARSATSDENRSAPANDATMFPQIHSNLHGMVREFVRTMYQDAAGNYWFGTNGQGLIRYDGQALEYVAVTEARASVAVRKIAADSAGNLWFGTSSGVLKFDGDRFTAFSTESGLQHEEIWGLAVDARDRVWVGSAAGVSVLDGATFTPFALPTLRVDDPQPMLSDSLVLDMLEDREGTMWLVTDGNGIFKYKDGAFSHLTKSNGLTDNNVADVFQDRHGKIWIGTFYGGVSRFDGSAFTHFTRNGTITGEEAYNFTEDRQGNLWFSAEGHGVYRHDGTRFTQFTTDDGLSTNVVQSILGDAKGQVWFGTWQGISIFDGETFVDAGDREPWTK